MDVWTWIAVVAAFAVIIVLGPKALSSRWSWRRVIAALRDRR